MYKLLRCNYQAPKLRGPGAGAPPVPGLIWHYIDDT